MEAYNTRSRGAERGARAQHRLEYLAVAPLERGCSGYSGRIGMGGELFQYQLAARRTLKFSSAV